MIEKVKTSDLIPYINNSRTHSDNQVNQIAASIKEFGFLNPVIIDKDNGIIAGHGRIQAANKLGIDEVPAVRAEHLTEAQKKAYIIADNQLALNAGWDLDLLKVEIEGLQELDFDVGLLGFEDDFIDGLLDEPTEGLTDDDHVPEAPEEPITKKGDLWILGNHRLLCGDSTNIQDVERLIDGRRSELLFTSPPYADLRDYNGGKNLEIDHIVEFMTCYKNVTEYMCVNLGLKFSNREVVSYWDDYIQKAKDLELKLLAWNVWDKEQGGSIASAINMFMITHEWIFVFGEDFKRLNRTVANDLDKYEKRHGSEFMKGTSSGVRGKDGSITKTTSKTYSHHQLHSVIKNKPELSGIRSKHPAVFPVSFPEQYIMAMTRPRDLVIDSFTGSGSTMIACEKTDRMFSGMEMDPIYCDVIIKRWQEYTGQDAILESTGETYNQLAGAA